MSSVDSAQSTNKKVTKIFEDNSSSKPHVFQYGLLLVILSACGETYCAMKYTIQYQESKTFHTRVFDCTDFLTENLTDKSSGL